MGGVERAADVDNARRRLSIREVTSPGSYGALDLLRRRCEWIVRMDGEVDRARATLNLRERASCSSGHDA